MGLSSEIPETTTTDARRRRLDSFLTSASKGSRAGKNGRTLLISGLLGLENKPQAVADGGRVFGLGRGRNESPIQESRVIDKSGAGALVPTASLDQAALGGGAS